MMKMSMYSKIMFSIYLSLTGSITLANVCTEFYANKPSAQKVLADIDAEMDRIDPTGQMSGVNFLNDVKMRKLISMANSMGVNTAKLKTMINERSERIKLRLQVQAQVQRPIETLPAPTPRVPKKVRVEGALVESDITDLTYLSPDFTEFRPNLVFANMPDRVAKFFTFDVTNKIIPASNPFPFADNQIRYVFKGINNLLMLLTEYGNRQHIALEKPDGSFFQSRAFIDSLAESMRGESHIGNLTALSNGLVLASMVNGKFRIYDRNVDNFGNHFTRREWTSGEHISDVQALPNGDFLSRHTVSSTPKHQRTGLFYDTFLQYWKFDPSTRSYTQAGFITDTPTTQIESFHMDDVSKNIYVLYSTGEIKTFQLSAATPPAKHGLGFAQRLGLGNRQPTPTTPQTSIVFNEVDTFTVPFTGKWIRTLMPTPEGGFSVNTFSGGVIILNKDSNGKLSYKATLKPIDNHFAIYYGFSNGTYLVKNAQYAHSNFILTQWSKDSIEVELLYEESP